MGDHSAFLMQHSGTASPCDPMSRFARQPAEGSAMADVSGYRASKWPWGSCRCTRQQAL